MIIDKFVYMLIECEILLLCDSARFISVKLTTISSLLFYLNPFLTNDYIKNDIDFEMIFFCKVTLIVLELRRDIVYSLNKLQLRYVSIKTNKIINKHMENVLFCQYGKRNLLLSLWVL